MIIFLCSVTTGSLVGINWHFRGTFCVRLQGRSIRTSTTLVVYHSLKEYNKDVDIFVYFIGRLEKIKFFKYPTLQTRKVSL